LTYAIGKPFDYPVTATKELYCN